MATTTFDKDIAVFSSEVGFVAVVLTLLLESALCARVNVVGKVAVSRTGGRAPLWRVGVCVTSQRDGVPVSGGRASEKILDIGVQASIKRATELLGWECQGSTAVTKLLTNVGKLLGAVLGNRAANLAVFVDFRLDQLRLDRGAVGSLGPVGRVVLMRRALWRMVLCRLREVATSHFVLFVSGDDVHLQHAHLGLLPLEYCLLLGSAAGHVNFDFQHVDSRLVPLKLLFQVQMTSVCGQLFWAVFQNCSTRVDQRQCPAWRRRKLLDLECSADRCLYHPVVDAG